MKKKYSKELKPYIKEIKLIKSKMNDYAIQEAIERDYFEDKFGEKMSIWDSTQR